MWRRHCEPPYIGLDREDYGNNTHVVFSNLGPGVFTWKGLEWESMFQDWDEAID